MSVEQFLFAKQTPKAKNLFLKTSFDIKEYIWAVQRKLCGRSLLSWVIILLSAEW